MRHVVLQEDQGQPNLVWHTQTEPEASQTHLYCNNVSVYTSMPEHLLTADVPQVACKRPFFSNNVSGILTAVHRRPRSCDPCYWLLSKLW